MEGDYIMPELPDVEVFRQYMNSTSLNKKITDIPVAEKDILKGASGKRLKKSLKSQSFTETTRHGKFLFALLDNDMYVGFHFGMTGFLQYYKSEDTKPGHVRFLVEFSNGYHLAFDCQRKLGNIRLVKDLEKFIEKEKLGPDALSEDFSLNDFMEALKGRRGAIKSTMMNQNIMAGVGNVYSDEIFFQVGMDPSAPVNKLKPKTVKELYHKMKEVLKTAIDSGADPEKFPKGYFLPLRYKGEECPRCGKTLKAKKVSGRTAIYCPKCQKRKT